MKKLVLFIVVLIFIFTAFIKSYAAIGDVWCAGGSSNGWCFNSSGNLVPYNANTQSLGSLVYPVSYLYAASASLSGALDMSGQLTWGIVTKKSTGTSTGDLYLNKGLFAIYGVSAATGVFSGALSAATLDTGNGANELYAMNQNVQTTSAVIFKEASLTYGIGAATGVFSGALSATTLDTGQGANELYDMDQNVQTTDAVAFRDLTLTYGIGAATGVFSGALSAGSGSFSGSVQFSSIAVGAVIAGAPYARLHIYGDGNAHEAGLLINNYDLGETLTDGIRLYVDSTGSTVLNGQDASNIRIKNANGEKLTIVTAGLVGINNPSPSTHTLDIVTGSQSSGLAISTATTSGYHQNIAPPGDSLPTSVWSESTLFYNMNNHTMYVATETVTGATSWKALW